MREHEEVKLMRSDLTDGSIWWAVRERNGLVTERWPLDSNSIDQLERMRASHIAALDTKEDKNNA